MERTGEVTAVQGEWLEITFCRPADCEKCNACHGGQKTTILRIKGKANVGDKAVVSMPQKTITRASTIAYALPLAGLMIGMLAGEMLLPNTNSMGGIIGGVVGLAIPAVIIRLTENARQRDPQWKPRIVRIISSEQDI
ncbi:MAG: SoxR reducing system RseC family protein [Clostridia bacterium]|nr:SoxR reducing system RseC family protein [Clostridia bacterium]